LQEPAPAPAKDEFAPPAPVAAPESFTTQGPAPAKDEFAPPAPPVVQPVAQAPAPEVAQDKSDALSRLLEVASKAPAKPAGQGNPSTSAINMAEIINKPQGKISRQIETIDGDAQLSSGFQQASAPSGFTSPFGGRSNDSSGTMNEFGQMTVNNGNINMSGGQASVSAEAINARIADLNRKLQDQRSSPMVSSSQTTPAIGAQDYITNTPTSISLSGEKGVGTSSSPSINALGQISPLGDEPPSSKAELVNRILNQASMTHTGQPAYTAPPPVPPARGQQDFMSADQANALRNIKPQGSKTQTRNRSRMHGPGISPAAIGTIVVVVLAVVGGAGFFAVQSGMIKVDLPKAAPSSERSVDSMIKDGDYADAIHALENKQKSGKLSAHDTDKLNGLYLQHADRLAKEDEDFVQAVKMLEKVPAKSKRYKDAQKMLRKYRKKVKKN